MRPAGVRLRDAVVVVGLHLGLLAGVVVAHRGDFATVGATLRLTMPALCALVVAQLWLMSRWRAQEQVGFRQPAPGGWMLGLPLGFVCVAVAVRGGFIHLDGISLHTFVVFICALALAALAEELTFRGFLLGALTRRYGRIIGIGVSSVAFGVAHAITMLAGSDPIALAPQLAGTALFGALLALIRLRVASLAPCIVLHFMWNFAVLSGRAGGGVSAQLAAVSLVALGCALASAVALALMYRRAQRALA